MNHRSQLSASPLFPELMAWGPGGVMPFPFAQTGIIRARVDGLITPSALASTDSPYSLICP